MGLKELLKFELYLENYGGLVGWFGLLEESQLFGVRFGWVKGVKQVVWKELEDWEYEDQVICL